MPFSRLRKKLPPELRPATKEFLEKTFQQPWWDQAPASLANDVATTLNKGLREGDSIERLIARLQNAWPDLSEKRARLIARTEAGGSLNAGLQAARLEQYRKGPCIGQDMGEHVRRGRKTEPSRCGRTNGRRAGLFHSRWREVYVSGRRSKPVRTLPLPLYS